MRGYQFYHQKISVVKQQQFEKSHEAAAKAAREEACRVKALASL